METSLFTTSKISGVVHRPESSEVSSVWRVAPPYFFNSGATGRAVAVLLKRSLA